MILKINNSTTLSTGQSAAAPIVELFKEVPKLSEGVVDAELKVWSSQANYNAGKDHTYLQHAVSGKRTTRFTHNIPQEDIDEVLNNGTDQAYTVIGKNYITYVKTALAEIAGCKVTDIEEVSLAL